MCMIPNDKKPVGNVFYKVFRLVNSELSWLIRDHRGKFIAHLDQGSQIKKIPPSTQGYNCWEDFDSAKLFLEFMVRSQEYNTKDFKNKHEFAVYVVGGKGLITGGTCVCTTPIPCNEIRLSSFNNYVAYNFDKLIRRQAYAFREIQILDRVV